MHHDAQTILRQMTPQGPTGRVKVATVTVAEGDTAWNPASTKHPLEAGRYVYMQHPDESVDVERIA